MPPVNELLVRIDATTEQLRREMRRADLAVAQTSRKTITHLERMDRRFNSFAMGLRGGLGALGLTVGGGALVAGFDALLQSMEDIADRAAQLGLTAEALQELRFAAEQNGLEARQLDDAWQRLNRRLGLAAQGGGPAVKAFQDLQIAVRDANGQVRETEDVFADVVRQLGRVESQAQRSALASELFGEDAGPKLVQLLDQGIDKIDELRQAAHDAGVVIDNETVRATAELNREWRVFVQEVSVNTQRAILGIVTQLKEWRSAIEDIRRARDEADLTLLPQFDTVEEGERQAQLRRDALAELEGAVGFHATLQRGALERALGAVQARIDMLRRDADVPTGAPAEASPPIVPGDRSPSATARAEEIDRIAEFIRQLRQQNELLGLEGRERAEVEAVMRAQAMAMAEGNRLTQEQIATIRDLAGAQHDLQAAQQANAEATRENEQLARELGLTFTSAFEDAILEGEKLGDLLKSLAQDLARLALRRTVTEPLLGFVSKFFAGGGQPEVGKPAVVGESGPELFIPKVPGRIVPAAQTAAAMRGGGAGDTTVFQIDARGADVAAVQRLERMMAEFQRGERGRVLAVVQDAGLRGGAFAGTFGR